MYYREFCSNMWSRHGTMFPITHQPRLGYCSIYAVSEEDAQTIRSEQHSRGRSRFKVFSDTLYMDFDDGDATVWDALPKLLSLGAPLKLWFSGKKGYHVEIPIVPSYGHKVPLYQRAFVENLNIPVDLTLYQHGRILSNPGRVHPDTGVKKSLVFQWLEGAPLTIPEVILIEKRKPQLNLESDVDHLRFGLLRLLNLINHEPGIGGRHTAIWGCCTTLYEAGVPIEAAEALLNIVNESWNNPKTSEELIAAIAQGYK